MSAILKKNKKLIIILGIIFSLPFIIPILEVLINCLFYTGKYVGTWVRLVMSSGVC